MPRKSLHHSVRVSRMKKPVKLQQAQVWKHGDEYCRIVRLERLEVEYMATKKLHDKKGTHHVVSKKDFCRLLKSATLLVRKTPTTPPPTE